MNIDIILCHFFSDAVIQFAVINIQIYTVFTYDHIIQNQWEKVDIISSEVQKPCIIIQRRNQMYCCSVFSHLLTNSFQLGCNILSCILIFQKEARFLRKRWAVFPDLIDQIYFILDCDILCAQYFFIFLSFTHRKNAAVKCNFSAFRNLLSKPFCCRRCIINEHLHQTYSTAFHLCQCLCEISSICPQTRIIFCDYGCSVGTTESSNELSCLEMLSYILTLMEICSRYNICIDILLCHQCAKLFNTLCYFCHFVFLLSLVIFPLLPVKQIFFPHRHLIYRLRSISG